MKKSSITKLTATLAIALGVSVVLNSLHAADAAAFNGSNKQLADHSAAKKVVTDDPNSYKLVGDLHNHVDKHTLKSLTKSFSEKTVTSDPRLKRHLKDRDESEADHFVEWLKRMVHSALLFVA